MTSIKKGRFQVICPQCGRERIVGYRQRIYARHYITFCRSCTENNKIRKPILERFWEKVYIDKPSSCWKWIAGCTEKGYGHFNIAYKENAKAHKFAFELFFGEVPIGLELDHLCRNRNCINPFHLEIVTHQENMRRGHFVGTGLHNRIKTHCLKGHPYNIENTYINPAGKRNCRICLKESNARRSSKSKE